MHEVTKKRTEQVARGKPGRAGGGITGTGHEIKRGGKIRGRREWVDPGGGKKKKACPKGWSSCRPMGEGQAREERVQKGGGFSRQGQTRIERRENWPYPPGSNLGRKKKDEHTTIIYEKKVRQAGGEAANSTEPVDGQVHGTLQNPGRCSSWPASQEDMRTSLGHPGKNSTGSSEGKKKSINVPKKTS